MKEHKTREGGDRVVLRGLALQVFVGSCFVLMVVCDEVVGWASRYLMLWRLVVEACGIEIAVVVVVCCTV